MQIYSHLKEALMNALLISLAGGFLVALGTGVAVSPNRARQLPGGSLAVGLVIGSSMAETAGLKIACAVAGVAGWAIYLATSHYLEQRRNNEA
jgi:hypothetical protein